MKPIGSIIQTIFGSNKVPAEVTVEQATQLLARATEQADMARAGVASKTALLENVLATAALSPDDEQQRNAAGTVAVAHRRARELLEQSEALVRGARLKLNDAEQREASAKRVEFEAEVNELLAGLDRGSVILEKLLASVPAAVVVMVAHLEKIRELDARMAYEAPLLLGMPYRDFVCGCIINGITGTGRPGHPMTAAADIGAVVRRHLNIAPPKVATPKTEAA